MTHYETVTRATTTKTHTINLGPGTTLDDLRQLVEATVHLGAGTPVQTGLFGLQINVHEVTINEDQETR